MRLTILFTALLSAPVSADGPGCDPSAIRWHYPHQFEEARARAAKEKRILLIKGVSFGIDDIGATCATKGRW